MDDTVIFKFLKDLSIPDYIRSNLKLAFESYDEAKVEDIIEDILLVKTTASLLKLK